ncbi:MarR family winged helix-turn-helix transcriptional regulator [Novosphingobium sp. G106]|uniref:MarR family winged helix-turn-helix transcriptional regulator n=1 Tax=Novosphingobium sp. G106 TaxID=2849500 RepID=UPI001C2D7EBB|nr:MarR family winged helix-turn-helix transcriptional regulator [Novosphingobium sp. G106]MBV1688725.1 MarR family winged helix-turn-helix transcriptional regulator [Novosphingobium sp. G106]
MHHDYPRACACTTLRKASRAVTRLYDERLAAHGMTTTQFSILRNLARADGELPLSRLAERLVMDRTSLYRTLAPVTRAGWAVVEQGPGRAKLARLTDPGRAAMAGAEDDWQQAQAHVLGEIDPAEWQAMIGTLDRLVEAAQV